MVQTLQARATDLQTLTHNFGLSLVEDELFFWAWRVDLPEITESERQFLDRLRAGCLNLLESPPFLERAVQMAVLGPMLFLAGFYLPPFHIRAEKSVEISAEDDGLVVKGQIDVLLLKEQFWTLVIESKEFSFAPEVGLAQLLTYMLASLNSDRSCFGLIATGGAFLFVKLARRGGIDSLEEKQTQYALSDQFATRNRVNGIYDAYKVLKRIGQL
ncbi:restriction endonuclease subunit R [Thermoleptolyngbya sichuanensis XZ-Cy5]|uniref:restriction endonuclease subunit R n=1 Tax=Thermoleptolyngbya sichuanensis TaxID=2885951 RepID=UPI00240D1147|nr:restriction endonuclease subunit R [Thermoleptolyngbya sichuanensis]MDG2616563.1 restriction endonuclease subunit R [Thermoleptolyngbya sichuanensis XZ-Cy5]